MQNCQISHFDTWSKAGWSVPGDPAKPKTVWDQEIDKWELLRDFRSGHALLDVKKQSVVVLEALLKCLKTRKLSAGGCLIVFPSNNGLSDLCNGMSESTLRRHLRNLIAGGWVERCDSPNGKRYRTTDSSGNTRTFGFDLSPFLRRHQEIGEAASITRSTERDKKFIRGEVSLLLRKIEEAIDQQPSQPLHDDFDGTTDSLKKIKRILRRKLSTDVLKHIQDQLASMLEELASPVQETAGLHACDGQNDRHCSYSNPKEIFEDEVAEKRPGEKCSTSLTNGAFAAAEPDVDLTTILKACPDVQLFANRRITTWLGLIEATEQLGKMIGITGPMWQRAVTTLGPTNAAATVSGLIQMAGRIKSPGAYLTSLLKKAEAGAFTPGPMIRALLDSN